MATTIFALNIAGLFQAYGGRMRVWMRRALRVHLSKSFGERQEVVVRMVRERFSR